MFINGVSALFQEFGCELAYPVYEGLVGTTLMLINYLISMIYLLLFLSPTLAASEYSEFFFECFGGEGTKIYELDFLVGHCFVHSCTSE